MCDNPILAHYGNRINPETGKRNIIFIPTSFRADYSYEDLKDKYGDDFLRIPCGKCPSCCKQYAKEWSLRLMLESLYHDQMCFVTLTYDEAHLPKNPSRKEMSLFMKYLRNRFGSKIRFFGCGERGEENHRFHMHIILFGVDFPDKKLIHYNDLKQPLYSSEILSSIWKKGLCSIGEVTPESCAYVARYSLKKRIEGSHGNGEFLLGSRRPGIGSQFFDDKKDIIYLSDTVSAPGFPSVSVPRYFDKLMEKDDDEIRQYFFELAKSKRKQRSKGREYFDVGAYRLGDVAVANKMNMIKGLRSMLLLRRSL